MYDDALGNGGADGDDGAEDDGGGTSSYECELLYDDDAVGDGGMGIAFCITGTSPCEIGSYDASSTKTGGGGYCGDAASACIMGIMWGAGRDICPSGSPPQGGFLPSCPQHG